MNGYVSGAVLAVGMLLGYALPRPDVPTRSVAHCRPIHVVRVVHVHDPGLNEIRFKALQLCRGDSGAPSILLSWFDPQNWEAICAGGHIIATNTGEVITAPSTLP
jgi:hypothetical protein